VGSSLDFPTQAKTGLEWGTRRSFAGGGPFDCRSGQVRTTLSQSLPSYGWIAFLLLITPSPKLAK